MADENRRGFLRTGTAAALGMLATGAASANQDQPDSPTPTPIQPESKPQGDRTPPEEFSNYSR